MNSEISSLKEQAFEAYQKKKFKDAARIFVECIRLLEEDKDFVTAAEMRNNLSVVLLELKMPDEALATLKDTDLEFEKIGDKKRQAMALGNMASTLQALNKNTEALAFFESSSELFKEIHETELRAITLQKIADLQLKTGKHYQALASLEASYDQTDKKTLKERVMKGFLGDMIKKITRRN
jgi:tetratricopeptide (TPR) repeat protein